jgi:hypothetical protein
MRRTVGAKRSRYATGDNDEMEKQRCPCPTISLNYGWSDQSTELYRCSTFPAGRTQKFPGYNTTDNDTRHYADPGNKWNNCVPCRRQASSLLCSAQHDGDNITDKYTPGEASYKGCETEKSCRYFFACCIHSSADKL